MGGVPAWISTFKSKDAVLFTVNVQHTITELRSVLGDDFGGVLVTDRFKVYDSHTLERVKQQKCLAHPIRNAEGAAEQQQGKPGQGQLYGQRLASVCRDGLKLHRAYHQGWITLDKYRQQGMPLCVRLDRLLNRAGLKARENERLRLGLLKQHERGRLLPFLDDPEIPPTNNAAERALRSVVVTRKVSQCSKNARGALTYTRIKSVVETARLRDQDPVQLLMHLGR